MNNNETDVLIIGAGIMGSSTAYHMAKRGVKPLVLEQVGLDTINSERARIFSFLKVTREAPVMDIRGSSDTRTATQLTFRS
ncbi:hypothetical protein L596_011780 [Steinernema carpocapsae]|uniref:FAD dependent oxidoreductase domain-containing protein n=1 Tax=Steinernema carpocapsae TaxID=34508 RepID=A0A4U5NVX7_STECR|nr:hypothetical protein L596_011780 [Steinernema carpocapsae]